MTTRKIKGAWRVDFRWERRRVRRKSPVNTKRGAEQFEARLKALLLANEPLPWERLDAVPEEAPRAQTVGQWLDEWIRTVVTPRCRPATISNRETAIKLHLAPAVGAVPLGELDVGHIDRLVAEQVGKKLHARSINVHLGILRTALRAAQRRGRLVRVPEIERLKEPPRTFDFFVKAESDRLLAAPSPHRAMIATALLSGLRIGELAALRWDDVDLVAQSIHVRRSVWQGDEGPPKGGRDRHVPIPERLARVLKAHRHLRGEYVFCHEDGAPWDPARLHDAVPAACRRAGLRRIRWHALRHSYASQLAMAGVPLRAIQELLGHGDIRETMRYAHLAPSSLREAVATFNGHQVGTDKVSEV